MKTLIVLSHLIAVILSSDTCYDVDNVDSYTGKKAKTVSGFTCQRWSKQYPHTHSIGSLAQDFKEHKFPSNYCRSPPEEPRAKFMWCYTKDPNVRWERCNVRKCGDEVHTTEEDDTNCDRHIIFDGRLQNPVILKDEIPADQQYETVCSFYIHTENDGNRVQVKFNNLRLTSRYSSCYGSDSSYIEVLDDSYNQHHRRLCKRNLNGKTIISTEDSLVIQLHMKPGWGKTIEYEMTVQDIEPERCPIVKGFVAQRYSLEIHQPRFQDSGVNSSCFAWYIHNPSYNSFLELNVPTLLHGDCNMVQADVFEATFRHSDPNGYDQPYLKRKLGQFCWGSDVSKFVTSTLKRSLLIEFHIGHVPFDLGPFSPDFLLTDKQSPGSSSAGRGMMSTDIVAILVVFISFVALTLFFFFLRKSLMLRRREQIERGWEWRDQLSLRRNELAVVIVNAADSPSAPPPYPGITNTALPPPSYDDCCAPDPNLPPPYFIGSESNRGATNNPDIEVQYVNMPAVINITDSVTNTIPSTGNTLATHQTDNTPSPAQSTVYDTADGLDQNEIIYDIATGLDRNENMYDILDDPPEYSIAVAATQ